MKNESLHYIFSNVEKSSDKWALYLDVYEDLFAPFRDRPISILEIGVQNGGFTEVLAAYFPNATQIVGCDIDPKSGELVFSDRRISVVVGDASGAEAAARINSISAEFDIIIDDGSHTSKDIVAAFCHYFPKLREGGLFVAEDLHCSYWYEYEGGLAHPFSSMSFFKLLTDIINFEHWGISQPRTRLVQDMLHHYGFAITEDELAKISSVEFFNSMSVVRKKAASSVVLGKRFVSGNQFSVADNTRFNLSDALRNDQHGNPYSDLDLISNKHVFGILAGVLLHLDASKFERAQIAERLGAIESQMVARLGAMEDKVMQSTTIQHAEILERLAVLAAGIEESKRPRTFFEWLRVKLRQGRR
jgi:SAM-dependent methyltransferase